MKITEKNYLISTIYFDGQFWCALIEQNIDGKNYAGRYVFGAEPANPRIIDWMINEFMDIPLLAVSERPKIRFKKLAENSGDERGIPKSLVAFSKAQKELAEERKALNRKRKKIEAKEKYLAKKEQKKRKK